MFQMRYRRLGHDRAPTCGGPLESFWLYFVVYAHVLARLRIAAKSLERPETVIHVHYAAMGRDFAQIGAAEVQER